MKRTGLNGYIYDFSIDYDAIAVDDIPELFNEKAWYKIMFEFLQKMFIVTMSFLVVMHLMQFHWMQFHLNVFKLIIKSVE